MLDGIPIIRAAGVIVSNSAFRQSIISQNIANSDTPGYRAKDVAGSHPVELFESESSLRTTRSKHFHADSTSQRNSLIFEEQSNVSPNGNFVSLETEMVKMAENRQVHEMALSVYKSSLNLLRTSLGRG